MSVEEVLTMEVVVQIGPQHLALAEPERFKVHTEGEKVVGVDVAVGYNHRGIEKLAERKTFEQDILLVERICGICSMSHPVAFTQAVEDIAEVVIPERACYLRMIIAEMERIHSHMLWAGIAAEIIGIETLFMYIWKDREFILDQLEIITGNRNHYAWNTIGGCRKDITKEYIPSLLTALDVVERRTEYYIDTFVRNRTIRARLVGTGILTPEDARTFCTVGPTARASGYAVDVRKDDPHLAYENVDFEEIVLDEGDNMTRAKVRLLEILESVKIIRQSVNALKRLPEGDIAVPVKEIPPGEGVGRYEAPRGEVFHYVKSNGTFYPERLKVRAPTYANIQAVPAMLIGDTLADVPITVASIDPCFCCTDR
jgi:membrane-bound hydrogenase subunit alpha